MENNNNNITASTVLTEDNREEFIKECIEKSKELIKLVEKYEKEGKPLEDYKKEK